MFGGVSLANAHLILWTVLLIIIENEIHTQKVEPQTRRQFYADLELYSANCHTPVTHLTRGQLLLMPTLVVVYF